MITIAVIIPTVYPYCNRFLDQCFKSILTAKTKNVNFLFIVYVSNLPLKENRIKFERKIIKSTPNKIHFLYSYAKVGFPQAINNGIQFAKLKYDPGWFFVINDDATINNNFFADLYKKMISNEFAVISAKVVNTYGDIESVGLKYFRSGISWPRLKDIKEFDIPIFCGTCFLLSKKIVNLLLNNYGYIFNPFYFAYSEDLELSLRILKNGGKIFISNSPLVNHLVSKTNKRGSFFQLYHSFRNWCYTIIIYWPLKKILENMHFVIIGQLYIILFSLYKNYFLLYPKIICNLWRSKNILLFFRHQFKPEENTIFPF